MQKNLSHFYGVFAIFAGSLILVVTMLIVIDAGGRFILNKPLTGGVEVSILLMAFIVFFALPYALFQDAHVRVTAAIRYLPDNLQELVEILVCIVGILLFGFVVYSTWGCFWESWLVRETMRAPIDLPRWLGKLAVTIGCLLFTLQLGFDLVAHIHKLRRRSGVS